MDLWTILTTLARRWYLSVPLIAASVGSALFLASILASAYTANASVLITAPNERIVEVPVDPTDPTNTDTVTELVVVNPLVDSSGNVGLAAATLQLTLIDDRTIREIVALGLSEDYTVEQLDRNSAILAIEADGTTPEQATDTVDYLIDRIDSDLDDLQDRLGAPDAARIDDRVLTRPLSATITSSGKPRIILGITMAGLVLTTLFVSGIDAAIRRRSDEFDEGAAGARGPSARTAVPRRQAVPAPVGAEDSRSDEADDDGEYLDSKPFDDDGEYLDSKPFDDDGEYLDSDEAERGEHRDEAEKGAKPSKSAKAQKSAKATKRGNTKSSVDRKSRNDGTSKNHDKPRNDDKSKDDRGSKQGRGKARPDSLFARPEQPATK